LFIAVKLSMCVCVSQPNMGHCIRAVSEDTDRRWQSSCIIC